MILYSSPIVAIFAAFSLAVFFALIVSVFRRWLSISPYQHIPGPPVSSMFGYLLDLHEPGGLDWHFQMTEKYGHVARLGGGAIGADGLYITDPTALHTILVREQNIFRESTEFAGLFGIIHHGDGLASVYGNEHKKQRKLIDPVFTASRIARLTPLFYDITRQLKSRIMAEISDNPAGHTIDILDHITRASLELIAQGGLGHTFNSFDKNSKEFIEFHWAITSVLPLASKLFLFLPYLETLRKMQPVWLRRFLAGAISYLPWTSARQFKLAVDIMHPIYSSIFESKKKVFAEGGLEALEESATGGKDLMTLLFKSNWEAEDDEKMPDDVIIANMGSVVHGAQETTSGALARFISLMALNPSLQSRLRNELQEAKRAKETVGDLDFYELNSLPLLDAVCRETLRIFAPVTFVWRQTIEDTVVPLQFPICDARTGKTTRDLLITKGTPVYLGLSAANRSTSIWGSDAAQFKPERWINKLGHESTFENTRLPGIYSNMMTFLGGGRACPGMKFAILELKLVLSVLLLSFSFEQPSENIDWKLGITLTPYVRGKEGSGPRVPVHVNLL